MAETAPLIAPPSLARLRAVLRGAPQSTDCAACERRDAWVEEFNRERAAKNLVHLHRDRVDLPPLAHGDCPKAPPEAHGAHRWSATNIYFQTTEAGVIAVREYVCMYCAHKMLLSSEDAAPQCASLKK